MDRNNVPTLDEADTVPFEAIKVDGPQDLPVNRPDSQEIPGVTDNRTWNPETKSWGVPASELPAEARGKILEPALVRGVILAAAGLASSVIGYQLDLAWVEPFISLYVVVAPLGLAWWIRRSVTPVKK